MNFLSPWFLAGAALIAGPIIFHLIQRRTRNRIRFSATQFLKESAPRLQKKSRIQNPWLLLVRCLIILLLAAAFARPYLSNESKSILTTQADQSRIILIDESASMLRADLFQRARDQAIETARSLGPAEKLAVYSFSDTIEPLLSFDQWNQALPDARIPLLENILSERNPSWKKTSLGAAINLSLAEFDQQNDTASSQQNRSLTVISDFAKGSRVSELANTEWPENLAIDFRSIAPENLGNFSLQWLGWAEKTGDLQNARIAVRSDGFPGQKEATLLLKDAISDEPIADARSVKVMPEERQLVLLPIPADQTGPFEIEINGDQLAFDNRLFFAKNTPQEIVIEYQGSATEDDSAQSAFYIKRALSGWKQPAPTFAINASEIPASKAPSLYILDQALNAGQAFSLREKITEGSFALLLADSPDRIQTLNALTQSSEWTIDASDADYALWGFIDFAHPQFAPFANPKFNDFSKIRFWKPASIGVPSSLEAKVITRFDNRDPAIIEVSIGKGSLLVWAGNWTPDASQWVLSSKFVPFLKTLAERSMGGLSDAATRDISDYAASDLPVEARLLTASGEELMDTPQKPGLYQIKSGDRTSWLALNPPPLESEVTAYSLDDWESFGIPFTKKTTSAGNKDASEKSRALNSAELESEQKLWRWIVLGAVVLLSLESLIAIALGKNLKEQAA